METYTDFASCNATLDDIDPAEIEQMLQQIQWEQAIDQQLELFARAQDHATNLDLTFSPLSGYASPSSMTTGSTDQSPPVPFLDHDMSFPCEVPATGDLESLFPELMEHPVDTNSGWALPAPEGYNDPFLTSYDAQAKTTSRSPPAAGQLSPTTSLLLDTMPHQNNPTANTYPTIQPPPAAAQAPRRTPATTTTTTTPPSSPQPAIAVASLTCPHCGAALADKTRLRVHTNKHTRPFRCAAGGCGYATAENKSLRRHLLARSGWDEAHRAAARREGLRQVRHRCPRAGCAYATVREDNLKRHVGTCAHGEAGGEAVGR